MITKKQFSLVAYLPKGFLLIALLFLCGTTPILAHLNMGSTVVVNTTMIQDDCSGVPQWSASEVYTNGMQAIFEGVRYRAKWWTRGEDPSKSGQWDVWVSLGTCDNGNPDPDPDPDPQTQTRTPIQTRTRWQMFPQRSASARQIIIVFSMKAIPLN